MFPTASRQGIRQEDLLHMWFDQYAYLDMIDTGYNRCYEEDYVEQAQESPCSAVNGRQIFAVLR